MKQTLTIEDPEHVRLLQGANERAFPGSRRRVRDAFGLRFAGGCCGTSTAHMVAIADRLQRA